jgi:membrane protein
MQAAALPLPALGAMIAAPPAAPAPHRKRSAVGIGDRVPKWVQRIWREPKSELNRWERAARFLVALALHCWGELQRDRANEMAAALTYHTLFSLLPTAALTLVVLAAFVSPEDLATFRQDAVAWALDPLVADAEVTDVAALGTQSEFDEARGMLDDRLDEVLTQLQGIDFGKIGIVGVLLFIYAATGLFTTIEESVATVFGTRRRRPWRLRIPMYYTGITLGPMVLASGQWVQAKVVYILEQAAWTGWIAGPLAALSPLLTTWLVLWLAFVSLPTVRVRRRAAAVGSLVSAILWVTAIELFAIYVSTAALSTLYGALALIPLFLLWLFVCWMLFLFGLELTYTLQTMRGRDLHGAGRGPAADLIVDPAWILPMAVLAARAFSRGEVVQAEHFGEDTHLPHKVTSELVTTLVKARVLRELDGGAAATYTLARPADQIRISEILQIARAIGRPKVPVGSDASAILVEFSDAELAAAGDRTLADLA